MSQPEPNDATDRWSALFRFAIFGAGVAGMYAAGGFHIFRQLVKLNIIISDLAELEDAAQRSQDQASRRLEDQTARLVFWTKVLALLTAVLLIAAVATIVVTIYH